MFKQKIFISLLLTFAVLVIVTTTVNAAIIAQCVSKFENVAINVNQEGYQLNEELPIITLQVTGNVPLNLPYDSFLYKDNINGTIVSSVRNGRMANGTADLDFKFTPTTTGKYVIVLIAGDNQEIREEKQIEVKKTFDLKLVCPIASNFVNNPVTCTWNPTDVQTNQVIPIKPPIATWTYGDTTNNAAIQGSSLTFIPTLTGSVTVIVNASADGYVDDNEKVVVNIQDATYQQEFKIDNKDYFSVAGQGVGTGVRTLELDVNKGLTPAEVRIITASITTPSGQKIPITFTKSGDSWRTTYNFDQAGQKYVVDGQIEFNDPLEAPIPFSYEILTLGARTESEQSLVTSGIILLIIGIIVIVGLIIFFVIRRRRKK